MVSTSPPEAPKSWHDIFGATPKSFSMASSDSSHAEAFVYANAFATTLQLSYNSQLTEPSMSITQKAAFFNMTAFLTMGVHQLVLGLQP